MFFKLKLAFRSVLTSGAFIYANIIGLAAASSAIFTIYLYVYAELQTDTQFEHRATLYRVVRAVEGVNTSYQTPTLAAPFLDIITRETGLETQDILRVYKDDELVSYKNAAFFEANVLYVDQHFFDFFDFEFKIGNPAHALSDKNAMVISGRIAKKYFGDENPLGKMLEIDGKSPLLVSGVLSTSSSKNHLAIDFIVNNQSMGYTSNLLTDIESHAMSFYLNVSPQQHPYVTSRITSLSKKYLNLEEDSHTTLSLQPFPSIYFSEPLQFDEAMHGNLSFIKFLIIIAVILLLLMAANFINLTIAKLTRSIKTIGVRKVLGASKQSIISDWIIEIYLVVFLGTLLGGVLCYFILPYLSNLYGFDLIIPPLITVGLFAIVFTITLTILVVLPPILIFSFIPSYNALLGKLGNLKINVIQHALLILQFVVAFVLIGFVLVMQTQYDYMQEKELGLEEEQIVTFNSNNKHSWQNRNTIKEAIQQLSGVRDVSMAYGGIPKSPTERASYQINQNTYQWNSAYVQPNFVKILALELIGGNDFNQNAASEIKESVVLNESAAIALGWPHQNIIGNPIKISEENTLKTIRGIVKDYHYESFKHKIEPLVIQSTDWEETFIVKLNGKDYQATLTSIEKIWKEHVPKYPFAYTFLDETFQHIHRQDTKQREALFFFTLITIIIAVIGTLGLSAFIQQVKIREIAIRKVLGASMVNVFLSLGKNILKALIVSILSALPISWLVSNYWLNNFHYRAPISPLIYVNGFVILVLIIGALLIIQSWKSITSNPVNSLKAE